MNPASQRRPARWNHNIHYHRVVLDAVSDRARTALDVGTGDGLLAAELAGENYAVTAIDIDGRVVERARGQSDDVDWVVGDAMTYQFGRTFDVVASVATLHHLPDLPAACVRLAELTAPGGVLVVVGLARSSRPADFAYDAWGALQHHRLTRRNGYWEHTAPTLWPPPHTYAHVRRCAMTHLPGVRWRRLPMFRYALVWRRPDSRLRVDA